MMNLILVVNKETNCTSRDVVNKLTKIFNTKKIGHTGTLDPLATGVLVCLTGKYTKLVPYITSLDKEYIAEIKLGIKTDTLDITGKILERENVSKLEEDKIKAVLNSFIGTYEQTVPAYSAISVAGKRLYEYARENKKIELPKRIVTIKEIELISYNNDIIKFQVRVSKGTYIRSLIEDICTKLNCLGCMNSLIRTKQGNFRLEDAKRITEISSQDGLPLNKVIELEEIEMDDTLLKKVINGNKLELNYEGYVLFKKEGIDKALYYFENNIGKIIILF